MGQHIPRLWVKDSISNTSLTLKDEARLHHLRNVLRLKAGDTVQVFNAASGAWTATIHAITKNDATLQPTQQITPPAAVPQHTIHLAFAPIRREAMEWLIEKVTELGVHHIHPVITAHTQNRQMNDERLQGIIIGAVEQSGGLNVPQLHAPVTLDVFLKTWPKDTPLYVGLESERATLASLQPSTATTLGILNGPEGGWSDDEVILLKKHATPVSLGPNILRAETAAIVAVGVAQSLLTRQ